MYNLREDSDMVFCLIAAYLAKVAYAEPDQYNVDMHLSVGLLSANKPDIGPRVFSDIVPLNVCVPEETHASFSDLRQRICQDISDANKRGGFAKDILLRDPSCDNAKLSSYNKITFAVLDSSNDMAFSELQTSMAFVVRPDLNRVELVHQGVINDWQAECIASQLATVVDACSSNPLIQIQDISLLNQPERHKILGVWNDTKSDFPENSTVSKLITQQAKQSPNSVAVKHGQKELSYAELDAESNQVARYLIQKGVIAGGFVALCLPRSVDLIVGLLGIIKTGAAYVPIDPSYPKERITLLLEDSGCSHILLNEGIYNEHLNTMPIHAICIDSDGRDIQSQNTEELSHYTKPKFPLYMIYTSGSTGRPKGVIVSHENLINHSWAMAKKYKLGADDCVLQSASVSFDVAAEQIFPALFMGSRVLIRPDNLLESFKRFENFINTERVSTLILPTAYWHEWVSDIKTHKRSVPKSLRTVGVGTEKVLRQRLSDWEGCLQGQAVTFHQGYGPTEATITCSMYSHNYDAPLCVDSDIPIGKPLPNVKLYVLDSNLQPLPVGFTGELFIGGRGVAVGYHKRAELTEERFIPDPFSRTSPDRLYRTGDLVRWTPQGDLVFVGRNDFQIKIRGVRVEIGEIEKSLEGIPFVKHAIVHPQKDDVENELLIAYIIPESNNDIASLPKEILKILTSSLPKHMIPDGISVLNTFPLTPNQKVDRAKLPITGVQFTDKTKYVAPSNDLEVHVAALWKKYLNVERVGRNDDFFTLGGNSLRAVTLLDDISASTGVSVSLNQLFACRTLAKVCEDMEKNGAKPAPEAILLNGNPNLDPIFFVCGIQLYQALAQRISEKYSAYGIFLPEEMHLYKKGSATSLQENTLEVKAYASRYIEVIRAHQPKGPYRVAGVSFGGVLAYEIARQLKSMNEKVETVVLFDAVLPSSKKYSLCLRLKSITGKVRRAGLVNLTSRMRRFRLKARSLFFTTNKHNDKAIIDDNISELGDIRDRNYWEAMCHYDQDIQPYDGDVTLFTATEREGADAYVYGKKLGWERHVNGDIISHPVKGGHLSIIFEPAASEVAKFLLNKKKAVSDGVVLDTA